MATIARDGAYDQVGGLAVGVPDIDYPFEQNGDLSSIVMTQAYKQTPAQWRADRVAGRYLPGVTSLDHPTYGTLYLLKQTMPGSTVTGLYAFQRLWARIPRQQTVPTSLFVTKPSLDSVVARAGSGVNSSTDFGGGTSDVYVYGGKTFFGGRIYGRTTGASARTLPTGGTFTLTFGANTTGALNYNDSAATINAAVNGLASVSGAGLTFTCAQTLNVNGTLQFSIAGGTTTTRLTINAGSLTPTASSTGFTFINSGANQTVYIAERATLTGHGFSAGSNLIVYGGASASDIYFELVEPTTGWSVIDANTIAWRNIWLTSSSATVFGQSSGSYSPGSALVRAKRVTDFYLPGVTTGVSSMDDVPVPTFQGDPTSILNAVLAGTTSINYEVGELSQWKDSPILARTITTLNATNL